MEGDTNEVLGVVDSLLVRSIGEEVGGKIGGIVDTLESELAGEARAEAGLEGRSESADVAGFGGTACVDHNDALAATLGEVAGEKVG